MDETRIRFVFGDDPDDLRLSAVDLDDEDARTEAVAAFFPHLSPFALAMRSIVVNQIVDDDPPEAWATVERLRADGLDPETILAQLALALEPTIRAAIAAGSAGADPDDELPVTRYVEALGRLPTPALVDIAEAAIEVARTQPGLPSERVAELVRLHLDRGDDDATVTAVDLVLGDLLDDGPLDVVAPDRLVHPSSLLEGMALTHRLTDAEHRLGVLDARFDLGPFGTPRRVARAGAPFALRPVGTDGLAWAGPDGWLDDLDPDVVVVVTDDGRGTISVAALASEPPIDDELVARVRAAYERSIVDEPLPVGSDELVLQLLAEDRATFAAPRPPLSQLVEAAGLERRGAEVAHDDSVWHAGRAVRRQSVLIDTLEAEGRPGQIDAAWRVLATADLVAGADPADVGIGHALDDDLLHEALDHLRDGSVLAGVVDALTLDGEDDTRRANRAFADALVAIARRDRDRAVANQVAALIAERSNEPVLAEKHIRSVFVADPDSTFALDRLAWCWSDRGDAPMAARMWRQLEPDQFLARDLAAVEPFAVPRHADLGRNAPCWCGSGRKYKQCHLRKPDVVPLADRVGWLWRKAAAFVERQGAAGRDALMATVFARSVAPFDVRSLTEAMDDPIVRDVVLVELGFFEQFLAARGELLPDDERQLASSWARTTRTVYEVTAVGPDGEVELRDLRTDDVVSVRPWGSRAQVGALVCGRAVPDGSGHQLVGGVLAVPSGAEDDLLELLDTGDAEALMAWVRQQHLPPELVNEEGEERVECDVILQVPDPDLARSFLDDRYQRAMASDTWDDVHETDAGQPVQRATIELDGSRLQVRADSDQRTDRVVAAVLDALVGTTVIHDDREQQAHALGNLFTGSGGLGPGSSDDDGWFTLDDDRVDDGGRFDDDGWLEDDEDDDEDDFDLDDENVVVALGDLRDRLERRWCDQPLPALGGRTPRQCAADPAGRTDVVGLIASFEDFEAGGPAGPAVGLRPDRLRELLGL